MHVPFEPIADPSCWLGRDLQNAASWHYPLDAADLADLDDALAAVKKRKLSIIEVRRSDVDLPRLAPKLAAIRREILEGRGFALLRGVSVDRYDPADVAMLYWIIGCQLGYPVSQNAAGHLIGHVTDLGRRQSAEYKTDVYLHARHRGYNSNARLAFHIDFADIIGLLCRHPARAGGQSMIVSSIALHNEILRRRPDLLRVLYEPFWVDRKGEIPAGARPYFQMPVFNLHAGRLTTYYSGGHMKTIDQFPELPPLEGRQREAMELVDELANDPVFCLRMDLERGDIQLLNNHVVLHARTAYEDFPEPERRRHLLRLWLVTPDGPPLPDWFYERYGAGRRGGIYVPGVREYVPVDPEPLPGG